MKALIEAAAIARASLGGDPYDWDRLRVVTEAELAEAERLARKNPPPIESIRVNRDTGDIVGMLMRQAVDAASDATPGAVQQRRHAGAGRPAGRGASSRSTGSDSDPPRRSCRGCSEAFQPRARSQVYCSEACGNAARQRRFKSRRREADRADAVLGRYRDEVWKACRKNFLSETEALELLIEPSERVLELLAKAAA